MKVTISTFELSNKAYLSWDACKIAEEVYQRACCDADTMEEAYDNIYQALDDEMIYMQTVDYYAGIPDTRRSQLLRSI